MYHIKQENKLEVRASKNKHEPTLKEVIKDEQSDTTSPSGWVQCLKLPHNRFDR